MNAPQRTPGQKAVQRHRERLSQAGIARFEVKAPAADKDLIRRVARALAEDKAGHLRAQIQTAIDPSATKPKGALLAALLNSPLAGSDIEFPRVQMEMRKVDL